MLYNIYTIGDESQTPLASIEARDSFDAYIKLLAEQPHLDPQTLIAFPTESTEA